jgi:hypothetical protein
MLRRLARRQRRFAFDLLIEDPLDVLVHVAGGLLLHGRVSMVHPRRRTATMHRGRVAKRAEAGWPFGTKVTGCRKVDGLHKAGRTTSLGSGRPHLELTIELTRYSLCACLAIRVCIPLRRVRILGDLSNLLLERFLRETALTQ